MIWIVLDAISCVTWLIYESHRSVCVCGGGGGGGGGLSRFELSHRGNLQQPVEFKIVRTEI